jgi:hypothetical protein
MVFCFKGENGFSAESSRHVPAIIRRRKQKDSHFGEFVSHCGLSVSL